MRAAGQPEIAARHPARAAARYFSGNDFTLKAKPSRAPLWVCTNRCRHPDRPAANARAYPDASWWSREANASPASRINRPTLSVASHLGLVGCCVPIDLQRKAAPCLLQSVGSFADRTVEVTYSRGDRVAHIQEIPMVPLNIAGTAPAERAFAAGTNRRHAEAAWSGAV